MEAVTWQPISGETQLATSAAHGFGTDAILLAAFAAPARGETVCDLGTGCGVVALRLCAGGNPAAVHGVDISETAVALAKQSAAAFGDPRLTFAVGDWNAPAAIAPAGSFDRVTVNPPYFPANTPASPDPERDTARRERPDTLPMIGKAAAWLLKNGGKLSLCHRPERLTDVLTALRGSGLEPKRLRPVQETPDTPPWLILLEAGKGARPGLRWEAPLILRGADGTPTAAWREIYHE